MMVITIERLFEMLKDCDQSAEVRIGGGDCDDDRRITRIDKVSEERQDATFQTMKVILR